MAVPEVGRSFLFGRRKIAGGGVLNLIMNTGEHMGCCPGYSVVKHSEEVAFEVTN